MIVALYANDVKVDSIELNDTNQWQYTFTDKEKYEDGKEINYTIKAKDIEGYTKEITGNMTDGYVVTYTQTVLQGHEKVEPTAEGQGIIEKIFGPKTGDQVMISGFIILLLASIGGILLIKRKKKD